MKQGWLLAGALLIGTGVGITIDRVIDGPLLPDSETPATRSSPAAVADEPLYWVAPMDPGYRRDKPGKSPMGMDLIPVYADNGSATGSLVKILPEVVNNLGVRTAPVRRETLFRKISTVGYLDYDETRISHIHTRTEGWIERLAVRAEGEQVGEGQLLFELYSPILVNAQEEYLQALASGNRLLSQTNPRARATPSALQALASGNRLLSQASGERLLALGVSPAQVKQLEQNRKVAQYVRFHAPQSGILSRLNVREGMYVKPDTEVMSLANLDQVWLLAEVFERQAGWVKKGQAAEARLPALPERTWSGEVEYIYPDLDPVTRTLRARLRFDNTERLLMPNMYAHVEIHGEPAREILTIPNEALIHGADMTRVVISLGNGSFEVREIRAGMESDDRVEVLSGLEEGEEIVVSAQFLIDSEASLNAGLQRLQSPGDKAADASKER